MKAETAKLLSEMTDEERAAAQYAIGKCKHVYNYYGQLMFRAFMAGIEWQRGRENNPMRINVYSQELTSEVMLVTKTGTDDNGDPATFKGVRIMLVSPETLHYNAEDDDRSAITFWFPKSEHRMRELANALSHMASIVGNEVLFPGVQ